MHNGDLLEQPVDPSSFTRVQVLQSTLPIAPALWLLRRWLII